MKVITFVEIFLLVLCVEANGECISNELYFYYFWDIKSFSLKYS